jgi:hypothetical protein
MELRFESSNAEDYINIKAVFITSRAGNRLTYGSEFGSLGAGRALFARKRFLCFSPE